MQTDLPDLDTLDSSAIGGKAEEAALERIHAALSEATYNDRLSLAALAIFKVRGCYFPPEKAAEKESLLSPLSDEALVSLAIAILEGLQASEVKLINLYEQELEKYLRKKLGKGITEFLVSAIPVDNDSVDFYIRPIRPIRPVTALGDRKQDFILLSIDYPPDDDSEAIVPPDCEFD